MGETVGTKPGAFFPILSHVSWVYRERRYLIYSNAEVDETELQTKLF